jgi:hypothetical protein
MDAEQPQDALPLDERHPDIPTQPLSTEEILAALAAEDAMMGPVAAPPDAPESPEPEAEAHGARLWVEPDDGPRPARRSERANRLEERPGGGMSQFAIALLVGVVALLLLATIVVSLLNG